MDAKEQLRKYLQQKLETGETELLLESMPAAEALKGLSGRSQRGKVAVEPAKSLRDNPVPDTDWRTILKPAGSEVDAPQSKEAVPAPPTTSKRYEFPRPVDVEEPSSTTGEEMGFKKGLVVGAQRSELFDEVVGRTRTLSGIAEKVAGCTRCPLYATATNPVPGEGNPEAKLICVGEAPGANEDASGRPFVGQSGALLTKILAAIDLEREDVFICNVLKHRPPGNRNPRPEEVEACSPYLIKQLELIQPKVIVAFGTFAAQTLLDTKTPIGKLRGLVHRYHGIPLVVTYHPAALLRNPAWKRPTWDDVKLARRILDSPTRA
jgi:uracil-DNA glycosylase